MKKSMISLIALCITLSLGCSSPYTGSGGGFPPKASGNYKDSIINQFEINVTTRHDVVQKLGTPGMWENKNDGTSYFMYGFFDEPDPIIGRFSEILFVQFDFDKNGKLSKIIPPKNKNINQAYKPDTNDARNDMEFDTEFKRFYFTMNIIEQLKTELQNEFEKSKTDTEKKFISCLLVNLPVERIEAAFREIVKKHMTNENLRNVNAFFESQLGQKIVKSIQSGQNSPEIISKLNDIEKQQLNLVRIKPFFHAFLKFSTNHLTDATLVSVMREYRKSCLDKFK